MTSPALLRFLELILLVASALVALKLYRTGLYRLYPVFFAYFIFRVPNNIWPLLLDIRSLEYLKVWIVADVIALTFYILLVRELYRLVLEKYKGLYTLGRWAMYLAMALSVAISAVSLLAKIKPNAPQRSVVLTYVYAADRGINTALVIFIVLLLLFLSRYPVRLSRNVRVYAVIYSIFFLSNTFQLLMRALFGLHMADAFEVVHLSVATLCELAWLLLLTPEGAKTASVPTALGPQYEHRLLTQLDSLNAALLKVGRRERVR
jgi:hypothetical protein